jgi:hypothetical protein
VAVDPVPLAIGQGAVHTDDVWRVAANAFSRDSQGIILPGQAKVTALGSPGLAVNVAAGGLVIRNAQSSGQSYVGRIASTTQVSIAANTSGATRRDLLIARIIDPDFSPWQPSGSPGAPNVSVADGPYFELIVISGVPANTQTLAQAGITYSGVALARIDIPTGTTSANGITSAMIVDLRQLAQPRVGFAYDLQSVASTQNVLITDTTPKDWPLNSLQVYVPRWATHAQVAIRFAGIKADAAADVNTRVNFAGTAGPDTHFDYNGNSGTGVGYVEVLPWVAYGEFLVTAVQDSIVTVKGQATRVFTSNTGNVWVDAQQMLEFDVRFSERAI